MFTRSAVAAVAALACFVALAGCYAGSDREVPASWLHAGRSQGPDVDGYGAWIGVRTGWRAASRVAGELIACDRDSVWVLTDEGLVALSSRRVLAVTLYTGLGQGGEVKRQSMSGVDREKLRPWARFPQGIPAGLDRTLIRPRPRMER